MVLKPIARLDVERQGGQDSPVEAPNEGCLRRRFYARTLGLFKGCLRILLEIVVSRLKCPKRSGDLVSN